MYNHLYKYLKENNILYEKQFGFQGGYSTSDAIVQLVGKIFDSFEKDQFTLGVFIDLPNAFDTVDHSILLKRWKTYGITDKNLGGFQSYLIESSTLKQVKIAKQILNMLLVASSKDRFLHHFCSQYMLTTCQLHLACQVQLCLPMILTFSLTIRTLNTSLQL